MHLRRACPDSGGRTVASFGTMCQSSIDIRVAIIARRPFGAMLRATCSQSKSGNFFGTWLLGHTSALDALRCASWTSDYAAAQLRRDRLRSFSAGLGSASDSRSESLHNHRGQPETPIHAPRELAPRAGLEPATLRLTVASRRLHFKSY